MKIKKNFKRYIPFLFALFIIPLAILISMRSSVGAFSGFLLDDCENTPDDGKGRSACENAADGNEHDYDLQIADYQAPFQLEAINAVTLRGH